MTYLPTHEKDLEGVEAGLEAGLEPGCWIHVGRIGICVDELKLSNIGWYGVMALIGYDYHRWLWLLSDTA